MQAWSCSSLNAHSNAAKEALQCTMLIKPLTHDIALQDLEKHRQVALKYLQHFERIVLPLKDLPAPNGTRIQRVQVRLSLTPLLKLVSCLPTS